MASPARKIAIVVALVMMIAAHDAAAATDFYLNLLRRGISEFNAGRMASAATLLRTAAFGLLESLDQFETAQAYVAVASQRLGRNDDARQATRRIVMAERIQRRFAALPLPADLRSEFNDVARRYLTGAEHAALTNPAAPPAARQNETTAVRRRTITAPPQSSAAAPPPATRKPAAATVPTAPPGEPARSAVDRSAPATAAGTSLPRPDSVPPAEHAEPDKLVKENSTAATPLPAAAAPAVKPPAPVEPAERRETTPAAVMPQTQENVPAATTPQANPPAVPVTHAPAGEPKATEPTAPPPATARAPKTEAAPQPTEAGTEPGRTTDATPVPEARTEQPVAPAPSPAPAPPQEAIREAQREFERKVIEVETSQAAPAARPVPSREIQKALADAAAALDRKDVFGAREVLRAVFAAPNLGRADLLRIAEEAYRAQDFALSAQAFERAGALQRGEELYGYYRAVALYETGDYAAAKAALADALPHIELTEDVARYRAKIEGAVP